METGQVTICGAACWKFDHGCCVLALEWQYFVAIVWLTLLNVNLLSCFTWKNTLWAYAASCWKIVSYKISTLMPIITIISSRREFSLSAQVCTWWEVLSGSGKTNCCIADEARKHDLAEKSQNQHTLLRRQMLEELLQCTVPPAKQEDGVFSGSLLLGGARVGFTFCFLAQAAGSLLFFSPLFIPFTPFHTLFSLQQCGVQGAGSPVCFRAFTLASQKCVTRFPVLSTYLLTKNGWKVVLHVFPVLLLPFRNELWKAGGS